MLCSTYQRYKMKGNHNKKPNYNYLLNVVFNISKIQNERKSQLIVVNHSILRVVFNISKIQNERKSQPVAPTKSKKPGCVQHIKDTKWKEITTKRKQTDDALRCVQHIKDTKWKEITTHVMDRNSPFLLCSTYQRYKMKGNHN